MKFSISQSELQNALNVVSKGVSTRSTLPVLSGVLVVANQDEIVLQTTNLELSIQYACAALVEEEGSTVFPAKLFLDIVKNLNDAAVTVRTTDDVADITCDQSSFTVKTLNAQDFPSFPHVDVVQTIEVPFGSFSQMVKRVARVVSKDESRAILTGVLINVEDGVLKMVATDSYRLAVTQRPLDNIDAQFSAVVSGAFLLDLAGLQRGADTISLSLSENQIVATYQDTVFINRRIEGNFPNYNQLIPATHALRVAVDKSDLYSAVKRTSILSNATTPVRLNIDPIEGTVKLGASTQDVGSVREVIDCEGEGEAIEIAFNCSYLLDGLSAVESDKVYLELQSAMKPGILTSETEENYLYLIMPVRI